MKQSFNSKPDILLPGLDEQAEFFAKEYSLAQKKGLILGAGVNPAAVRFEQAGAEVAAIIDDDDLLVRERLLAPGKVKYMDYFSTDYADETFGFIYAQASVSVAQRNKILKESFRLLKPGGVFCLGDVLKRDENTPVSVVEIWEHSNLHPVTLENAEQLYTTNKFSIENKLDLSQTIEAVYRYHAEIFEDEKALLSDEDRHAMRKELKRMRHEANMFVKMGAKKHMHYYVFLLRKPL
jgi:SAM-dependent methyltransferase